MLQENQILVWQDDTAKVLEGEFNKFVSTFEQNDFLSRTEHGFQSTRHQQISCESAIKYIGDQLHFKYVEDQLCSQGGSSQVRQPLNNPPGIINEISQEDIDTLQAIIKLESNFIQVKPRFILGLIAQKLGRYDMAVELFNDCIQFIQLTESGEPIRRKFIKRSCDTVVSRWY